MHPRGRRAAALLAAGCAAMGLGAGCTVTPRAEAPAAPAASPTTLGPDQPTDRQFEIEQHTAVQQIMRRRTRAVRVGDERAFLADLDPSDAGLVARQRRLYANLRALPRRVLRFDPLDATWPIGFAAPRFRRTGIIPYVTQSLQLRGFDPVPVRTTTGMTVAQVDGRWRIVSDDDVAAQEPDDARAAPWDLTRISTHRTPHVLGVFDRGSESQSGSLMRWAEQSAADVRAAVPGRWSGSVVVYALSSDRVLRRLGTRYLDRAAVAYAVPDDSDRPTRVATTRVVINPRYLPQDRFSGVYLLRHELTHVALAPRTWDVPTWLSEGLAEYVAAGGSQGRLGVPASVAQRVRRGVDRMPTSTFFGDADPAYEYLLSHAACRVVVQERGERQLWRLLDVMATAGRRSGDPEGAQDRVLRRALGYGSRELARRAGRLLLASAPG